MGTRSRRRSRKPPPEAFVELLLTNPARARIMKLLTKKPGMNRHRLARHLGIHPNAVHFHIRRLGEAGLVVTRSRLREREKLCFTAENVSLWDDPATRVLFGRGAPRDVAAYLADHPCAQVEELSQALELPAQTVRRHLRILEHSELVQRMRVERQVVYHAEPELKAWVEEVWGDLCRGREE